jgi:uncharacterized phage protein gp47/JayE
MYENMTYEEIMRRCLARVPASMDKREGSVIWDALAPAAAELAQMYIEIKYMSDRVFPDTEPGDDLTKKVREHNIWRLPATAAIRLGLFYDGNNALMDVPVGSRYSGADLNYIVAEKIDTGQFRMRCETVGAVGNQYSGTLFPIPPIAPGLGSAVLSDILINGEDEEADAPLYARYVESLKAQAYGGNIADYRIKTENMQGVGAAKIIPVWNGGGTVKVIFINSDWGVPSDALVDSIQTALDPTQNNGEGEGVAPIGHVVTVEGVIGMTINVTFTLTFNSGATWDSVKEAVTAAIQDYFDSLSEQWKSMDYLIVRVSQIESRILDVSGIIDITGTTINGGTANISLASNAIPTLGTVTNATN